MKYKLIGIAVCLVALVTALAASRAEDGNSNRYHQHLREPGYTPCTDHGDDVFCSHLPLIFIDTEGVEIPGDPIDPDAHEYTEVTMAADGSSTITCSYQVVDTARENHHVGDAPSLETRSRIRIRGNTSRVYEKKGYLLRPTEDDNVTYKDVSMLGMGAHNEWALHGPILDKTLIRNYMWYNIGGEIMDWAPNARFCEVFVNGEYRGVYVLVETITNGNDCRLNFADVGNNAQQTGYVVRMDLGSATPEKNITTFTQYTLRTIQILDIVYPGRTNLTPEIAENISQEFSDFEKALYSFDYDTPPYDSSAYLDVQSFVDYFLIHEFTVNYDAGFRSTYVYKDLAGKYKMCIWDFNGACDNFFFSQIEPHRFQMQGVVWFYMLCKDDAFIDEVIDRYRQLRKTYLSDDYLIQYIDDTVAWLGPAVDRNFQVWGHTFAADSDFLDTERNLASYEAALEQLKNFCLERGAWMDENIEILRQYGHPSKVKKFNH